MIMAEEKNKGKLIFYGILLIILFFGLIGIFISANGLFFGLELAGMLLLLLLSLIALSGYQKSRGERVLFFVFLFYITNLVLVWYFVGPLYLVLLFVALLGFVMSVPRQCCSGCNTCVPSPPETVEEEEPHSEVFDAPPEPERQTPERKVTSERKKATSYSPGKYVASKRGKYFHEPKSEWAKKITKANQIWFQDKKEAYKQGYKAHQDVA
jgi:hypothetical protein